MYLKWLILILGFLFKTGSTLVFPKSPCPDIYDYYKNEKDVYYGLINFKNDNSSVYTIEVNMTMPRKTNETIYLIQAIPTSWISNGKDLVYLVEFPSNETFPTLTKIKFNGRTYCNSPTKGSGHCLFRSHTINTTILDAINNTIPQQKNVINKYPDVCGITIEKPEFSTNKSTVANGEYPWLVAIFKFYNGRYFFVCGGNLISDKHVLTAAHCVKSLERVVTRKRDIVVVLGTVNIRNWAVNGVSRGVERVSPHKDYVTPSVSDIALITLDRDVDFDDNIRPICIWDDLIDPKMLVGKHGIIAGWGLDEERKAFINNAKQVKIPVVDQNVCLNADERYKWLVSQKTFCAGDKNVVNPCTGDSGSGFVIKNKGRWMLRGIVSTGLQDNKTNICESDLYTIFVDVGKYRKWLIEEFKDESRDNTDI